MPTQNAHELQVQVRMVENVAILDMRYLMTSTTNYRMMTERIHTLLDAGHKNLLSNLRDVEYIDSSGAIELLQALGVIKRRCGTVKILHFYGRPHSRLVIDWFNGNFEIFGDEPIAVASFNHKE